METGAEPDLEALAKLQTKNVFVDTSVHVAAKFAYSSGGLRRLADLAEGDLAVLHHTEIDAGEIRSRIGALAEEASNGLKRFQREAAALSAVPSPAVTALFHPLDADGITDLMVAEFLQFQARARSVQVPLVHADLSDVFARYFARTPPFEDKKKSEFPDACAISALAGWCWQRGR